MDAIPLILTFACSGLSTSCRLYPMPLLTRRVDSPDANGSIQWTLLTKLIVESNSFLLAHVSRVHLARIVVLMSVEGLVDRKGRRFVCHAVDSRVWVLRPTGLDGVDYLS
jgi:hypothetical protein